MPHKTAQVVKKQVEPAKVEKKPVVSTKLKTEAKEVKEVKPVKGKEVSTKTTTSKSHINSPKKGAAVVQAKSQVKSS